MRTNPFQKVYSLCNSGNTKLKFENLEEFPRYLDIELTNLCNFRCLMCPTGTNSVAREKGYMQDAVYYKILDEIKEFKTPIRFIRWGEPTLHPRLTDYLRDAADNGILTHMNTNGSRTDRGLMRKLIDIPLHSLKFSFQGVDVKSYREMRNKDYYDGLMNVIREFYEMRGDGQYPYIHVSTTITYETKEQVEKFKNEVSGFADLVTVGRTIMGYVDTEKTKVDMNSLRVLKMLKEKESVVKKYMECPEIFDKLSINWDGTISACCNDYDNKMIVGSLLDNTLKEIWRGDKINSYRRLIADMQYDGLELCRDICYDYLSIQTKGLQDT